MEQIQLRFDPYLPQANSTTLQNMARIWGLRGSVRKEAAIVAITSGLESPAYVAAALQELTPLELAALAIFRRSGGIIRASQLLVALRSAGYEPPNDPNPYGNSVAHFAQQLRDRGIALIYERTNGYYSPYGEILLFTDARLLQQVPPLQPIQISLPTVPMPTERRLRRPAQIALDLIGLTEAVRGMGGLQLTKSGAVRVNDIRKLSKALNWNEVEAYFDGLLFTRPLQALLEAMMLAGNLTIVGGDHLVAAEHDVSQLSASQMVGLVLNQFGRLQAWYEYDLPYWSETFVNSAGGMRLALLGLFESLYEQRDFIDLETLSRALFDRIGTVYSLNGPHPRVARPWNLQRQPKVRSRPRTPIPPTNTPSDDEQIWLDRLWAEWRQHEERWITYALAGWLYFLGIVEVGIEDGLLTTLRLSDLARSLMRPEPVSAPQTSGTPWLIQPNFEIVVYLEQVTPSQLAMLERAAERIQTDVHIARYHLTRDSVARWTDQTGSFENLLAALGPTIPQNVSASMREWVTQHERITLRRRTSVLIFPTATARDAALSDGIAGRPIGERAILMNPHAPTGQVASSISYSQPPPPTLKVSETGQISIARNTPDLLTEPLLERWAERDGESWKLTAASIAAATKRNQRIEDLLRDLDQRLTQDMPPILRLALKNWANPQTTADLGRLTVLRLPDAETTDALLASKRFALLFAGRAGERILLVERAHLAKLRELLDWNGITIVEIDE